MRDQLDVDDKHIKRIEALCTSMTAQERLQPDLIDMSRRRRIARGAGQEVGAVNQLLKQWKQMKQMMKAMKKMGLGAGLGAKEKRAALEGMAPGGESDEESVRQSLRASLVLACEKGLTSIAVPAIGTGVGGFPLQRCAEVSLEEARAHLEGETSLEEIRFVLFGEPAYRVFEMVNDAAKVQAQMDRLAKLRERR